jgi:hypothetical protein
MDELPEDRVNNRGSAIVLRAAQYTDKKYEYVYALNMRV